MGLKYLPLIKYRENDPLLQFYQQKLYPKTNLGTLKTFAEVNSQSSMKTLLLDHKAMAVMPELSIQQEIRSGKLVDIGTKPLYGELYLTYLENQFANARIKLFTDFIKKEMKGLYL